MWPKNWYPRFEEWLYTAKQKSFDEFREAERSEVMKEYERLLDEITKQRIAGQPKKGETELDVKKITEEEFRRFLVDKLESLEEHCISY